MTRWPFGPSVVIVPSWHRAFVIVSAMSPTLRLYFPNAFATSAQFTTFHHAVM